MSVRPAGVDDVEELVRLRALMEESMGIDASGPEWRESLRIQLVGRLRGEGLWHSTLWGGPASVVLVVPGGSGLRACGVGYLRQHLPGPTNPTGLVGHVSTMCTDVEARRQGFARAIFEGLMAWFDERGIRRIELNATPMGESLYREHGFRESNGSPLIRNR